MSLLPKGDEPAGPPGTDLRADADDADRLDATFAVVPHGMIVYGPGGEVRRMNAAAERILGVTFERWVAAEELAGRVALVSLRSSTGAPLAPEDTPTAGALRGEEVRAVDLIVTPPGGESRWVSATASPLRGPGGELRGAVTTYVDVTERVAMERRLAERDEQLRRYELLARATRDIVLFVRHEDGRIVEANDAAVAAYGYPRAELLRLRIFDLRAPGSHERTAQQMAEAEAGGILFETVHRRRDGTTFPVEVSSIGATMDGARTLMSVVRDVTDRRRAEEALRESEERLRLAIEAAAIATWSLDVPTATLTFHAGRDEVYGLPRPFSASYTAFLGSVNPADRQRVDEAIARSLDPAGAGRYQAEYRWRRPAGDELWIVATGRTSFATVAGRRVAVRLVGAALDITERKRAEERLREADRRKTEFLAVLSHELRNPLAPIRNGLHILERAPGSDAARRAHEVLRRQAEHLTRLVDDLLDVTRISYGKIELQLATLDAREVVRLAVADARGLYEESAVALELEAEPEPLFVQADAARLLQVMSNLLGNALKFTPAGGRVSVAAARRGDVCELRVKDSGIGIDPGDLERIFEPFLQVDRTRRTRGGVGLGLALVRELVEKHGGTVLAESGGPGRGAEFVVRIPSAPAPAATRGQEAPAPAVEALSVLIVEDNEDAAATLADLLELSGHRVRTAGTARAGVDAFAAAAPDVLICDIGLPDGSGHDVIREVRAMPNGRRVLAVALSGYAQPEDRDAALAAGFDAHLPKPPRLDQLEALLSGARAAGAAR